MLWSIVRVAQRGVDDLMKLRVQIDKALIALRRLPQNDWIGVKNAYAIKNERERLLTLECSRSSKK